ncbi:MAG TPA: hypothetical protein VJ770_22850 [Stellaceae bacterium]|nr:hypothetical protein [Stellaceae bacterium]
MAKPEIRKFLTVSSAYLPRTVYDRLQNHPEQQFAGDYGVILYAPDSFSKADGTRWPRPVERLLLHARRKLDCSYVLFDVDGVELDGFPLPEKEN